MPEALLTMSAREVDRAGLIRRVLERRLSQVKVAQLMGVTTRQARRMCRAYQLHGARGLVSGKRGKPSNNRSPASLESEVMGLVRDRYSDFGPTLAAEKLVELHRVCVSDAPTPSRSQKVEEAILGRGVLRRPVSPTEAAVWPEA